jgi:oligoribonuclease (3'-5' exoribonuclease)
MSKAPSEAQPLVFLDLETSGLDPGANTILEVGAYCDARGTPHRKRVVVRRGASLLDEMNEIVFSMHAKNGLLRDVFYGENLSLEAAEEQVIEWLDYALPAMPGDYNYVKPILAGETCHFDMAFLKVHMPRLASRFDYMLEDVSALKRMFRRVMGRDFVDREILPETQAHEAAGLHRALEDAEEAAKNHRLLSEWLRATQAGEERGDGG